MTRTEGDTWDPAKSVGATATMVAAARAAAARRPTPVVNDPFAEPLVRAVGLDVFTRIATGELDADADAEADAEADADADLGFPRMIDTFAARALYFDEYLAEAGKSGLLQVVILASGLDARPYRLPWPAGTTVYELDQPEVIDFKISTLAKLGAAVGAAHHPLGVDLRDDWPVALQSAGFDPGQPTAWLAEGLLIGWLPPEAEVALLENINALSDEGSQLAADYGQVAGLTAQAQQQTQRMTDRWRALGLDLDVAELTYPGEHTDVAAHLWTHGWQTNTCTLEQLFIDARLAPLGDAAGQGPANSIEFVRAVAV